MKILRAPFPWFGGKSRAAHLVWPRFGDVPNYVEPFAGSLAVLLGRPTTPRIETVNDLDCYLSNFWRAVQLEPEAVAEFADWPVNEADLHARHKWLVKREEFREQMKTDPDFYDAKIAGWWCWGICQWIGSGWCSVRSDGNRPRGFENAAEWATRPHLGGQGLNVAGKRPSLSAKGGLHRSKRTREIADAADWRKRPVLAHGNRGVNLVSEQVPMLRGDAGAAGAGIHASGISSRLPKMDRGSQSRMQPQQIPKAGYGTASRLIMPGEAISEWMLQLQDRLRRVRVCCGDWTRVIGRSATECIGVTGVFLDPPYGAAAGRDPSIYNHDDLTVAGDVREWAIANGDNPKLRIALCGYEGEHNMPDAWECVAWKATGGYASSAGNHANSKRERIWFSPHCLKQSQMLFGERISEVSA
ncbi:MAG TPA: DNA adenine methylase [Thermoanaerobaculia bacterium]|jgi:site-specific DNA-adenine methylase|nr:DNA adenine methylase [Thermoanaerobaculia bacterium]